MEVRVWILVIDDRGLEHHPQHLSRGGEDLFYKVIGDGKPHHPQHLSRGGEGPF